MIATYAAHFLHPKGHDPSPNATFYIYSQVPNTKSKLPGYIFIIYPSMIHRLNCMLSGHTERRVKLTFSESVSLFLKSYYTCRRTA